MVIFHGILDVDLRVMMMDHADAPIPYWVVPVTRFLHRELIARLSHFPNMRHLLSMVHNGSIYVEFLPLNHGSRGVR